MTPGAAARTWGVEVNECAIFASGSRAANDWWAGFLLRADRGGRATCLDMTVGGGRWLIACEDHEHAEWLRNHMIQTGGIHRSFVKRRGPAQSRQARSPAPASPKEELPS